VIEKGTWCGKVKGIQHGKGKGRAKENKLVEADDRAWSAENLIVSFSCLTIKYGMVEYNTVYYSKIRYRKIRTGKLTTKNPS